MATGRRKLLISAKDIDRGAITHIGRKFDSSKSKGREARISVSFPTANAPTPIYHALGFVPTGFTPLTANAGAGTAPGKIYGDVPLQATSRCVVLYCDTANTVAEILLR